MNLPRRALAEFLGTALLVAIVVGSGIMAQTLSPGNIGLQLLENSTATVFGLGVLIAVLGPISGAHFNPVVSLADWWHGRRDASGLPPKNVAIYIVAQVAGGIGGSILANAMFAKPAVSWATTDRSAPHLWIGEIVATAGLIVVIFCLVRAGRAAYAPVVVASYIGAAYWFTSSTSFANPAVTIGRIFSDSFAGIAPSSVPGFLAAQLVGGIVGLLLVAGLMGQTPATQQPPSAQSSSPETSANGQITDHSLT
ncbi:MIP/aquaporin family protein [Planotetraspora kaengkrachanensis]|uniref:Glycerol uptake transporter protein n=1 Tax=Planotetraspora kaengkrachanensis TaxID=575193 RepID=A0A8J3VBT1_9ACTN|nr:MIP/aquaporin family protein [Planotetraspora kaengkrachanensis]GIG84223.1 glycerol uptake transporter protein [Planotetraspora kaengkrachanensis]